MHEFASGNTIENRPIGCLIPTCFPGFDAIDHPSGQRKAKELPNTLGYGVLGNVHFDDLIEKVCTQPGTVLALADVFVKSGFAVPADVTAEQESDNPSPYNAKRRTWIIKGLAEPTPFVNQRIVTLAAGNRPWLFDRNDLVGAKLPPKVSFESFATQPLQAPV